MNFKYFFILGLSCFLLGSCQDHKSPLGRTETPSNDPPPIIDPVNIIDTDIGNGGDLIQCFQHLPRFPFSYENGWYILDYAEDRGFKVSYFKGYNIDQYIKHLRSRILFAAPELLHSFDNYLSSVPFVSYKNHRTVSKVKRTWILKWKNEEIHDENPSYIPMNCQNGKSKFLKLHQVLVRKEFLDQEGELELVKYYYDKRLVEKIGDKDLQLSMLILHEWLWDLYPRDKARELRSANRVLHSIRSVSMSKDWIRKLLNLKN